MLSPDQRERGSLTRLHQTHMLPEWVEPACVAGDVGKLICKGV